LDNILRITFLRARAFTSPDDVYSSIIKSLVGDESIPEEAMEEMVEYLKMQHQHLLNQFSKNLKHILDQEFVSI
jgi:hypothetical protein